MFGTLSQRSCLFIPLQHVTTFRVITQFKIGFVVNLCIADEVFSGIAKVLWVQFYSYSCFSA